MTSVSGSDIPRPASPTEPTGTTIGDLMALAVGVALAASLEWYSGWAAQRGPFFGAVPDWPFCWPRR